MSRDSSWCNRKIFPFKSDIILHILCLCLIASVIRHHYYWYSPILLTNYLKQENHQLLPLLFSSQGRYCEWNAWRYCFEHIVKVVNQSWWVFIYHVRASIQKRKQSCALVGSAYSWLRLQFSTGQRDVTSFPWQPGIICWLLWKAVWFTAPY